MVHSRTTLTLPFTQQIIFVDGPWEHSTQGIDNQCWRCGRHWFAQSSTTAPSYGTQTKQEISRNWNKCKEASSGRSKESNTCHTGNKWRRHLITEICAELLLARWSPHFDYNSPAGNFWVVAGSNDPWRCGLASPSMGSWINSAGVLLHFAEDDPSLEALEGGRTVRQWIT